MTHVRHWPAYAVLVILGANAALLHYATIEPPLPTAPELSKLPDRLGDWSATAQNPASGVVVRALRPDDYMDRSYTRPGAVPVNLVVAWFGSRNTDHGPHSPKNCLPANGWRIVAQDFIEVAGARIPRLSIAKDGSRATLLYWYQARDRITGDELLSRVWQLHDNLRYRRADISLVRIIAPAGNGGEDAARRAAADFASVLIPPLATRLSSSAVDGNRAGL